MPTISAMLGMPTPRPTGRTGSDPVDDERGENLHQHVAGGHRDEQSQREAERADEERHQLDRGDQPQQPPGVPCGTNSEKKCRPWRQKPTIRTIEKLRIARETGDREVARHGEGMQAEQAERHQADHVEHQDEHEKREDIRRIFPAFGADIRIHHAGNEAGEAFDGDLPATGDELALHPADHEDPQQAGRRSPSTWRWW